MGFREWEFVEAYAASRASSMLASAEASAAVARAVMKFMAKAKDGYAGKLSILNQKLQVYRDNANQKDWPATNSVLSTELSRLKKPLAEHGIKVETQVDRRKLDGSQQDVILSHKEWVMDLPLQGL